MKRWSTVLLSDLYLFLLMHNTLGVLNGAIVLPHGDFAYSPQLFEPGSKEREVANVIHTASFTAGEWCKNKNPDVILIVTPHGIQLSKDFAVYLNSKAAGFAEIGGDLDRKEPTEKPLYANATLSHEISARLLKNLSTSGENITGIESFADTQAERLGWGEVIPIALSKLQESVSTELVVVSVPLRRYSKAPEMVPELLGIGRRIAAFLHDLPEDVLLLISADLAHTHLANGPYGYSEKSALFDDYIGKWAQNPIGNEKLLTQEARELEQSALSCGYPGIVVLQGAITAIKGSLRIKSKLLANANVTYYGMMVAIFEFSNIATLEPSRVY